MCWWRRAGCEGGQRKSGEQKGFVEIVDDFFFNGGEEVLVYFCQCFEKCHRFSRTVSRFVKLAHWRVIEREHLACSSHLETLLLSPTPRQLRFHFFTSLREGKNRTRAGRDLLRAGPRHEHNVLLLKAGNKWRR